MSVSRNVVILYDVPLLSSRSVEIFVLGEGGGGLELFLTDKKKPFLIARVIASSDHVLCVFSLRIARAHRKEESSRVVCVVRSVSGGEKGMKKLTQS